METLFARATAPDAAADCLDDVRHYLDRSDTVPYVPRNVEAERNGVSDTP